jgi:hypothetical protein
MPKGIVNSHIIPQHHLKQFANDKGCIFTYPDPDKNGDAQCISKGGGSVVKNTAAKKGYYSSKIEIFLNQKFESRGSKIALKILKKQNITPDERNFFVEYIASFVYRSPITEITSHRLYPKILKEMQSIDYFMQIRNRPDVNMTSESEYFRLLMDPAQKDIRIKQVWEKSIEAEHQQIYELLLSREWWVAEVIGDEYFITSDNPLFYSTTHGMADRNIQITFPLSQKMALVFDGDREPSINPHIEYYSASQFLYNQVDLINKRTADSSGHLYSPKRDVYVQSLLGYQVSGNPEQIRRYT